MSSQSGSGVRAETKVGAVADKGSVDERRMRWVTLASSVVLLLIGVFGILSWAYGIPGVESVDPDFVPIAPLASLSYVVLAVPLLYSVLRNERRDLRWVSIVATAVLLSVYFLKGLSAVTGLGTDVESLLPANPGEHTGFAANRISPVAAVCIPMACLSILVIFLTSERERKLKSLALVLAAAVALVGLISVLGYAYGTPLLYGGSVRPIALSSGIGMMFLGLGIAASTGPGLWPVSSFVGSSVRARMMRTFLPLTTVLVFLVGIATVRIAEVSNNPVLGASLIAIMSAFLVGWLVYRISSSVGGQIDSANAIRREAEEKLRAANEKLTMLGSITRHDIINEVTVLNGWTVMAREADNPKDRDDSLRRIENATRSIEQLVAFTGVYQEVGLKAPEWIDVRAAFSGGAASVSRFRARVNVDVGGLKIFADRMLEKVFTNLVDNSARHGEHVTAISLTCSKSDDGLRLVYEDDGVGVPDSDKPKLFVRGFGKHTGLGLYLSKEILGITGLTISETGTFGKGARFEILVPPGKFRFKPTVTTRDGNPGA